MGQIFKPGDLVISIDREWGEYGEYGVVVYRDETDMPKISVEGRNYNLFQHCVKYNKKNWCKLFIKMMDEQKLNL